MTKHFGLLSYFLSCQFALVTDDLECLANTLTYLRTYSVKLFIIGDILYHIAYPRSCTVFVFQWAILVVIFCASN